MKKYIIILTIISISALYVMGATTPLNVSLFPPYSIFKESNVIGLDIGFVGTVAKEVYGVQFAPLCITRDNLVGIQCGIVCFSDSIYGIQFPSLLSFVNNDFTGLQLGGGNFVDGEFNGVQIGIANRSEYISGVQIGVILNGDENPKKMTKSCKGVQISLLNAVEDFKGLQLGIILNRVNDFSGFQFGYMNIVKNDFKGLQIGCINYCGTLEGVQIGIINIALRHAILPIMVGINVGW